MAEHVVILGVTIEDAERFRDEHPSLAEAILVHPFEGPLDGLLVDDYFTTPAVESALNDAPHALAMPVRRARESLRRSRRMSSVLRGARGGV